MSLSNDVSSPFVWPPAIYGAAAVVAGLLAWFWPLGLPAAAGVLEWTLRALGACAVLAGILVARSGERRFIGAGTEVRPDRPTSTLVTDGIYARTRNPMYLGMTIILIGLGFAVWSWWFFFATPVAVAVTRLAIEREERYLAARFGQPYLDYLQRTRRWL